VRSFEKNELRARLRLLLVAVPVGVAGVFLFSSASLAEGPTIEAAGASPYFHWAPSSAQTAVGGTVTFKSASGSVEHGVTWTGGPETPKCAGVPIDEGKTSWSGSCSFAQAGTYSFYCPVHQIEMKGTITASTSETPTNPAPPSGGSPESPTGPALEALELAKNQHGNRVRGLIDLLQAGGRLKVDLLATRASLLGGGQKGTVRVGRLIRSSLGAGRVRFAVGLRRVARRALQRRGRLPLTVRLTITPPGGKALILNRSVAVHD
jgi:plastocyanin